MDEQNNEMEQTPVEPVIQAEVPAQPTPVTPTGTGGVVYASFLPRFLAILIDGFIITIPLVILIGLFFGGELEQGRVLSNILSVLISATYLVYFDVKSGQTIGKKILGIKVVKMGEQRNLTIVEALLRETLGRYLSSILFLGYLWVLWDKDKQGWHDKLAKSIVVKA